MNSAVDRLLKEINELKVMVSTLDAEQKYLLKKVNALEANQLYGHMDGTAYVPQITTTIWNYWDLWEAPTIRHVSPNDNWTLTFTYNDGRAVTISSEV